MFPCWISKQMRYNKNIKGGNARNIPIKDPKCYFLSAMIINKIRISAFSVINTCCITSFPTSYCSYVVWKGGLASRVCHIYHIILLWILYRIEKWIINKNRYHGDDSDFTNIIDMFVGYEVKPQGSSVSLGLPPIPFIITH